MPGYFMHHLKIKQTEEIHVSIFEVIKSYESCQVGSSLFFTSAIVIIPIIRVILGNLFFEILKDRVTVRLTTKNRTRAIPFRF